MTSEFAERLQSQSAEGSWQSAVGKNKRGTSLGFVILDLEFYRGTVTFLEKR